MENEEINSDKLDEILELQKDNNKMLKKVLNHQKMANLMKILYWIVIIGITYGMFAYFKPYLTNLKNIYTQGSGILDNLKDVGANQQQLDQLDGLIKKLK